MANSTIIYAGTDDGLAILNKPGTSPEWLPPRKVLQAQRVAAVWGEPGPPIREVVVADGKLMLSENGGRTWDPVGPSGMEGAHVLSLDYDEKGHILKAINREGRPWVSTDGGTTWQIASRDERPPGDPMEEYAPCLPPGTLMAAAIPGAEGRPAALVAGTLEGLQVSADAGDTWSEVALPHEGSITVLARDPERRDRLYAATDTGYLFESGNRGQSWQPINSEPVAPVRALYVLRI